MHTELHLQCCQPATSHLHQPCKLISLRSRAILEAHQEPQPRAHRLLPLNSPSNGGLEGFSPLLTLAPRGGLALPTITECQLGCQAGNHSEGLPFRHSTPLCLPLPTPVPCCGCCLPWSPSSQPLMLRASCLCSKPSIPAQEQSQGAEPCQEDSAAATAAIATLPHPGSALHQEKPQLFFGEGSNDQPNLLQELQGCEPGTLR